MTRIDVHLPDGAASEEVCLPDGVALLIGREPSPAALDGIWGGPLRVRCLKLPSGLVSSNHLLLWKDEAGLHARDLHSKNGTYLQMDPEVVVSLPCATHAQFVLAAPRTPSRTAAPREVTAVGADARVFANLLKEAIAEWLARCGLAPELHVAPADSGTGDGAAAGLEASGFTIPLVEGLVLQITDPDVGRTRARWDGIKAELFTYTYEQIGRWRACGAVRGRSPLAFSSPGSARALREVLDAARARLPLVLRGESGTGKTALAAIYAGRESLRSGRDGPLAGSEGGPPFVTVNCANLEPTLAHSMLFGALKGSYTSSEKSILGAVKLADGGVLFLDDVDALPLETQAKLLRFLDEGQYEPLGHGKREPLVANLRVVAGTNVDLRLAVREKRFREDLYWRLHMGQVVRVPPLRERPEDIEQLLRSWPGEPLRDEREHVPGAERGARAVATPGGRSVRDRLDAGAVDYLLHRHTWRGNFRECLRFCTRVLMEAPSRPLLDQKRCEEILAETALEPEEATAGSAASPLVKERGSAFDRAFQQSLNWWLEQEGDVPERFDEVGRFCESYLKSSFVAQALGLAEAKERPESFDRERRQRLGCDLTTLKRKMDDYLALRQSRFRPGTVASKT
jgi:DNA-binding NtrC family response regulator